MQPAKLSVFAKTHCLCFAMSWGSLTNLFECNTPWLKLGMSAPDVVQQEFTNTNVMSLIFNVYLNVLDKVKMTLQKQV